ncbi:MAG: glycerol kinase GlpK [Deltaproteobacteria bacterium]|nr:glycerol kinase GlpK [Deltaproteobacteria bacterium]
MRERGDLVLAVDQGTTGTTTLLVDSALGVLAKANCEFPQIFPRPGWVEHDLEAIWQSTEEAIAAVLRSATVDPRRISAIGITNQRETVGLWARDSGQPIHNAIVWQCRRTADACRALRAAGHEPLIRSKTGLVLDPYFSGTKLAWLLDNVPEARSRAEAGDLVAGTIDSFLVFRLTAGAAHVTDVTNASRTLLFDLETETFDDALLDLLGVPRRVLPEVASSSEIYGTTKGLSVLPDGIPIAGIAGDQHAALFGQACFDVGDAKCTYGTGAFILVNTGARRVRSEHGLLTTVAWKLGREAPTVFALEGSVFVAGAAVQWLRDGLGLVGSAAEIEALARSVPDSGDVVFVPALTGLGAPHWRPEARGLIAGITRDSGRAHLARAALEGVALACDDVMQAMREDVGQMRLIRVDGGASVNDLLMQIQADLAGVDVSRPSVVETTALGAACLAGLATGFFRSVDDIKAAWREEKRFEPNSGRAQAVARLREKWAAAIVRA